MRKLLWTPRKYQRKAVSWLIRHPEAGLFMDPGLGKTTVALDAFMRTQKAGGGNKALVIGPLRVCQMVWTQDEGGEIGKWSNFKDLKVVLLHGRHKNELVDEDADIYVINYDGLQWLIESGGMKKLIKKGVNVLICDELSKLKSSKAKRFKILKPWLKKFRRRWGLTGSPASNGLLDLFGQVFVLDLGKRLGPYITHFRTKYFLPTGFGGYTWVPQTGADKRIYKALKTLALSMKAEDHLDLPKLMSQTIWVDLPPKVRKVYDTLEHDFIASLEDGVVTAANAAVASGKCRQVASGGVYVDDEAMSMDGQPLGKRKRQTKMVHDEKTNALVELVEELQGSPLLVAYEFQHDLVRIRKALGKDTPAINGKTTAKQGKELVRAWNAGELPVLCGHPAAMAHGLNLQASGHHICWYSTTWDFELYHQLIRRVWRQGSKAKRVIVHHIIARKTVDEVIIKALAKKKKTQDSLFDALRAYRKARA